MKGDANMTEGREAEAENGDQGREYMLVSLTWLPECRQSLKNRGRSRVFWGEIELV